MRSFGDNPGIVAVLHLVTAGRQAEVMRQLLAVGAEPKRLNKAGIRPVERVEVHERQPGALLKP
ncbi:MAG: hypothetical protein ACO1RX_22495 [Candidatus Sericytochromatia bacterium]